MVFSPNALQSAPYKLLATIMLPGNATSAQEVALARSLGKAFPAITPIRVKDAIAQFNAILDKVLMAVRVAGSVTLVSGALVLAGALATAQRRRILDAVILKAIGVTRRRILTAHLIEYGLLALIAAAIALGLGSLAAWITVHQVMNVGFAFSWSAVAQALGLAFALVALFGGIGTLAVLRAPGRAIPQIRITLFLLCETVWALHTGGQSLLCGYCRLRLETWIRAWSYPRMRLRFAMNREINAYGTVRQQHIRAPRDGVTDRR